MDANSEILHFSRLQLPYSCSISVRTEFGNNIILVIQIVSELSIAKSCGPNHNQLHIYELGETFGGYWGAFPDDIFNVKPENYTKFYTLKTTPKTVETSPVYTEEETEETTQTIYHKQKTSTQRDFVRFEVPLLNVSGDFGFDEVANKNQDMEELLDLIYDVAPRNRGTYDTSVYPLVEFSIEKQEKQNDGRRYNLVYGSEYTPDSRITFSTLHKRKETKRYTMTRRLNFRRKNTASIRSKHLFSPQRFSALSPTKPLPTVPEDVLSIIYNNSWNIIDRLMASLNTTIATQFTKNIHSISTNSYTGKMETGTMHTKKSQTNESRTEPFANFDDEVKVFFTKPVSDPGTGSLLNRKTFENVVQAAPIIAVLLNNTNNDSKSRNKRYIKSLDIENARPRSTTHKSITETTEKIYKYSNMQDLAQLVELQDDELQGRVSLRYLRKYVGPALFNICDYHEPKTRQVYLFNASRIVIAISNFTLERMTLVVTPARSLLNTVGRCPPAHLECQVAGTRVCIDSTNECDGVPNCGAYDIYDEDRLQCGWSHGLQHNVCLAACTFVAVILTLLYMVHYWLKRCVPRVSQAFFIYSDASENILYLDTVMRSPNDTTDDYSKLFYQANIFDDDDDVLKENDTSLCTRIGAFLFGCLRKKKADNYSDEAFAEIEQLANVPRKLYSFTELELRNIAPVIRDAGVQTGSSLEISKTETSVKQKTNASIDMSEKQKKTTLEMRNDPIKQKTNEPRRNSELNLLQLIRNLKISDSDSSNKAETEINNTVYEKPVEAYKISNETKDKHLRFDEDIVTIPRNDSPEISEHTIEDEKASTSKEFRSFWRSGKKKQKKSHLALR
ncbi:uncharacterized protein LOC123717887 isoform X2 [Pieris brassicae]|nr:uncharacterized protein LOC123717887 isoform X2 [Pieris brassicae]